jgi:hypothetical protein
MTRYVSHTLCMSKVEIFIHFLGAREFLRAQPLYGYALTSERVLSPEGFLH